MSNRNGNAYRLGVLTLICAILAVHLFKTLYHPDEMASREGPARPHVHSDPLPFELRAHPLAKPLLADVPGPLPGKILLDPLPDTATMRRRLYGLRDFASLERDAAAIRKESDPERRLEDLRAQTIALSDILWRRDTTGMAQTLLAWVRASPQSPLAHNVLASFYYNHAWEYRGTKFAKDVPDSAWEPFFVLLAKSKSETGKAIALEPENPQAHYRLLRIDVADGTRMPERERHYREAVKLAPWSYLIRSAKLTWLQPRWHGGDGRDMFAFAEECLRDTLINPRFKRIMLDAYADALSDYDPRKKHLPTVDQARMLRESSRLWKELADAYPEDLGLQLDYVRYVADFHLSRPFLAEMARIGCRWKPGAWETAEKYLSSCSSMYFVAALGAPTEEAIPYLRRSVLLNRDTDWVNPNYHLGKRLASIGDYAGAEEQFKLAVARHPSYRCELLAYLSVIQAQVKKDTAGAVRYARQVFDDVPTNEARTWAVAYLGKLGAPLQAPAR